MKMPVRVSAAAVVTVAIFLCLPAAGQARRSPSPMIEEINRARAKHGVRRVRYSRSLSRSSRRYARHLARTHQFTHASRIVASRRFSRLGEILALMRGHTPRRRGTVRRWLSSSSHRAVLLSPEFRYVGAGRAHAHFNGRPSTVWTVQFGRL
jgi:uncharacterized protein YkwD